MANIRAHVCLVMSMISAATGWITIKHTKPDGTSTSVYAKKCTELAPGVNYCQEIGSANVDVLIDVKSTSVPEECKRKVKKDSQLLLMFTGDQDRRRTGRGSSSCPRRTSQSQRRSN